MSFPSSEISSAWQTWNDLAERWYQRADAAGLAVTFLGASPTRKNQNDAYVHGAGNTVGVVAGVEPSVLREIDTAQTPAAVVEKQPGK